MIGRWRAVAAVALIVAAASMFLSASLFTKQREGRKVAIDVLCGFANGVADAGRGQLTAPVMPPKFRRNLERLGLPPAKVRARGQRAAADAYARVILRSVERQAGAGTGGAVIRDGRLDCRALQHASRSTKP